MPSPSEITVQQLSRLVGTPEAPAIVDVRSNEHFDADPRFIPCAVRRDATKVESWAQDYSGQRVVVACQHGGKLSQGAAAWLRTRGIAAESLEGGHDAWATEKALLVDSRKLPPRDAQGHTVWVTRARPKVDRIACPWLIRRFVDRDAVLLFVNPIEVAGVAERFKAAPYDVEGVFWSHRSERCSFDTFVEELGLSSPPLDRLALIVRGADTARQDLAPEAAGLLAASFGYSRMYKDDLEQLAHAMEFYDALYRWARDAMEETHNWPSTKPKQATKAPEPSRA
jgi:rhodanese-related sulfurtransferase